MGMKFKWKSLKKSAAKYKYVIAVVAVGILLMGIPGKVEKASETHLNEATTENSYTIDEDLEALLSSVRGAGEVQVLLTLLSGEEIVYKTDDRSTGENINATTVIVTDSDRNQTGLIQQQNPPIYRGAIVVCDGADKPDVRLAITEAVRNVTGLRTDQISVLKMK